MGVSRLLPPDSPAPPSGGRTCPECGRTIEDDEGLGTPCRACSGLPSVSIADTVREEVTAYLRQDAISSLDIHRMCCLLETTSPERAELVGLVLQVALVKPRRRGRRRYLRTYRPGLLRSLEEAGLLGEGGAASP